ncbi:SGNH/GDSL hydrolase family protein [Nocardiopsis potens]|uniref:SGNH/GDSL hydrolase family protein n=1 Tax=Nocardiopsis potens TaxID=1246458 RepID=UPI00034BA77C|nr:SGNH/GDSL hydrolase family protein [Nocardiopsis potens]
MNKALRTLTAALPPLLLAAACSGSPEGPAGPSAAGPGAEPSGTPVSEVVLLGDSVAVGQSLPLAAALEEAGVGFTPLASEGGGNVVGPFSEDNWKTLPGEIGAASPDVVLYQLTTYDWGTRQEQLDGYGRLLETVAGEGADLVFITSPPIRPDDFYEPHMGDLERASEVAREVVEGSSGRASLLDAAEVWGREYVREREGAPDRSPDGIHTCPQGAARFTDWLLGELAGLYPGFPVPEPEAWAGGDWAEDEHFAAC